MKRIFALTLAILILTLTLAGCDNENVNTGDKPVVNEKEEVVFDDTLKLAYSKNDSLNPLECKTQLNSQLLTLVFEGLFTLSDNYEPKPAVALEGIVSGNVVNVTLGSAKFSDGSNVTADDVLKSFFAAKESPVYSTKLSNFLNAVKANENMIMFSLEKPDPFALSCLDFPVVRKKTDSSFSLGTGKYYFLKNKENTYLALNTYKSGFEPKYKTIKLVSVYDSDSIESSIVIGDTAFYYNDISDGEYSRINAHTVDVGLNSLVFLGVNTKFGMLSDSVFRNAVNKCIDREKIVSSAFRSHARVTYTPYNPDWYALGSQSFSFSRNLKDINEYLKENERELKSGQLTFMYCKDNPFKAETAEIIIDNLKKLGFIVNVKAYSREAFDYDLAVGSYDLYLGEIKLTNNMDLSVLLGDEANLSRQRYDEYLEGKCQLIDFINTFNEDVAFIPLCYRNALVSYTNSLSAKFKCNENNLFEDIDSWSMG